MCNITDMAVSIGSRFDPIHVSTTLKTGIYTCNDLLSHMADFINSYSVDDKLKMRYEVDEGSLFFADVEIRNSCDFDLILKLHRSLAFNLGMYSYQRLKEINSEYVAFNFKAGTDYVFRADSVQNLKTISLYADSLFSGKNVLSEQTLTNRDFSFFNKTMYSTPVQSSIQINSKVFKLDREKNIYISKCYLEDVFGDRILFDSVSLNATLIFEM